MVVPAAVYVATNLAMGSPDTLSGWAVPTATDIAFALAVLAVLSTHLPSALRTFLLTLAVVDDLLAITVIAVFYTDHLAPGPLALALVPVALFAVCVQRGVRHWWILVPLAVVTWALVHASGVHATVAGVVLGFTVPVLGRHASPNGSNTCCGRCRPGSPYRCSPSSPPGSPSAAVRARRRAAASGDSRGDRRAGHRQTPRDLGDHVPAGQVHARQPRRRTAWRDVLGVSMLAGIGFTVSLLISELAFGTAHRTARRQDRVLAGSVIAGLLAAVVLISRNAAYRRIHEAETADDDHDGVPDVYEARQD